MTAQRPETAMDAGAAAATPADGETGALPELGAKVAAVAIVAWAEAPAQVAGPTAKAEPAAARQGDSGGERQILPAGVENIAGRDVDVDVDAGAVAAREGRGEFVLMPTARPVVSAEPRSAGAAVGGELPASPPSTSLVPNVPANEITALLGRSGAVPTAAALASTQVTVPFAAAGWTDAFAERLVWASGRHGQVAELVLNPPSFGSVEVRISLHAGEAEAHFFSPHAAVRETLEAALPRLKEMLSAAGLSLGEAMVSQQPFDQRRSEGRSAFRATESGGSPTFPAVAAMIQVQGTGLLDLYI